MNCPFCGAFIHIPEESKKREEQFALSKKLLAFAKEESKKGYIQLSKITPEINKRLDIMIALYRIILKEKGVDENEISRITTIGTTKKRA